MDRYDMAKFRVEGREREREREKERDKESAYII